jgi:hypothetical protein
MPVLTKPQIIRAFNAGELSIVARELLLYSVLVHDKEWTVTAPARYAGFYRRRHFNYKGLGWITKMHNGDVISVTRSESQFVIGAFNVLGEPMTEEQQTSRQKLSIVV